MKIIELTAENIMKLNAIQIKPKTDVVLITGKNGQGKTSVLNAIAFALGGEKLIVDKPIKEGKTSASVAVDLGDFVVTRRWTEKSSTLKIESKDGMIYKSPQTMLNKIVGELSFDPLVFMKMMPKSQRDVLLKVSNLEIDLDEMAAQRAQHYAARTEVNRQYAQKSAELLAMGPVIKEVQEKEVSVAELAKRLLEAKEINDKIAKNNANVTGARESIIANRYSIEQLESQIQHLKEENTRLEKLISELSLISQPIHDLTPLHEAITHAEQLNQEIRARAAHNKKRVLLAGELGSLKAESENLTQAIERIDADKKAALMNIHMPLAGLGIEGEDVIFNGIPLSQCSSSEQLKVSLGIAMALNPELRVIRITDGSLLDSENLKIIAEMAQDKEFQVWVEKVDESKKVGIVIEDGSIVATN